MTNRNPGINPKHTLSSGVDVIWGMDAAEDERKDGEEVIFGDDDGSMGVDAPQAATGDLQRRSYTMLGQKTSLKTTTALKKLMGKRPQ